MYNLIEIENDIKLKRTMEQYLDESVKGKAKYDDFLNMLVSQTDELEQGTVGVAFRIDFVRETAMRYNKELLRNSLVKESNAFKKRKR